MIIDNLIELNTINKSDLTAEKSHVLNGKLYVGKAGIKETGTMPNIGAVNVTLAAGESYKPSLGYHNGQGTITAKTLAEQTTATAGPAHILAPYTAWVTGGKVTGTMVNRTGWTSSVAMNSSVTIPQGYHDGTKSVTGPVITNRGTVTSTLNAGQSYSIATGYYTGGTITANSLASQTPGTATSADIKKGKKAWVNGIELTGTATLAISEADLAFLTGGNAYISAWYIEQYGNAQFDPWVGNNLGLYVVSNSAGDADYGKALNKYYKVQFVLIDKLNQKKVDWSSDEAYSYTLDFDVHIEQYKAYSYDYNVIITDPNKSFRIANVQQVYPNLNNGDGNNIPYTNEAINPKTAYLQYGIRTGVQYGGFNLRINIKGLKVYYGGQLITTLYMDEKNLYKTTGIITVGSNPII